MALLDNIRRLSENVRRRQPNTRGEQATKNALILPFLDALGYDIFDPTEVHPEYIADFAKKRPSGPSEKVDYAIYLNGMPIMFFECKSADVEPNLHNGQLQRYFNATPSVKVAVVTNGIRYLFFTDLEEPNIMDSKAFFEFDVLAFSERDVETLEAFSKAFFDAALVRQRAEDIIYTGKVTGYVNELLRNPSESFTRFLLDEINITTGRLTAKRLEKFVPIVKKAIQSTLLEMATRSIKQETYDPVHQAPAAAVGTPPQPSAPRPAAESQPDVGKGVVTTVEELEAFEIIQRICADSTLKDKPEVQYLDAVNYFGLNIGNRRKWFMRLFFDGRRKAVVTRLAVERASPLVPGFEIEPAPENIGKSRVYIAGLKDLERLRPLVLLAYEEEVKRAEASSEDDDAPAAAAEPLRH
ncbi:hypothetical protein SOCEGT47_058320 [Sorangium cellulosum]|uniref:Restriction endonuclease type I HsdR N-terminal domain-containing protein n=1 Tax=Sorangium cellulosum TaxID=56 RepID=A0A4P2Q807_SORCE|nr:type I restriction endonuclease [Sorangium cellulosum]AUX25288.1 hypothetical protein SOCEGT47_058320 [Sorangium cellulosum]